jgi:hypothetical protein
MLAGAAHSAGHEVRVVDLNIDELSRLDGCASEERAWAATGDHAKPRGGFARAKRRHRERCLDLLGPVNYETPAGQDPVTELMYGFDAVNRAALEWSHGAVVERWVTRLGPEPPPWVGFSIMFAGQVLDALALSSAIRRRWPGTLVVWGGAHVTLLIDQIAGDERYGKHVDAFVAGYAEQTFVSMCEAGDPRACPGAVIAGSRKVALARGALSVSPQFGDLDPYGVPRLTLPTQTSRGCAYGRCAFCTYPSVEGAYDRGLLSGAASVIAQAAAAGADLAFKDALMVGSRVEAVSEQVAGQARFSITTRVRPRLGRDRLLRAASAGLSTLEVGVETTDPQRLHAIGKRQCLQDIRSLLVDLRGLDVHVVLNFMSGYPGQSFEEARQDLRQVERVVRSAPEVSVTTERNLLQVQRRSPLAREPERFGIRITDSWPWATSLGWNAPAWRADGVELLTGHHAAEEAHE